MFAWGTGAESIYIEFNVLRHVVSLYFSSYVPWILSATHLTTFTVLNVCL